MDLVDSLVKVVEERVAVEMERESAGPILDPVCARELERRLAHLDSLERDLMDRIAAEEEVID